MAKHSFSNTQVAISGWQSAALKRLGRAIPDKDLAEDGREAEPHITVQYGIEKDAPPAELKRALAGFGPIKAKFGKVSLFENDDADVMKIDIVSPDLHRLRKAITAVVDAPGNTHPKYLPHATVAYLKPGKGKDYKGDATLHGQELTFDCLIFSGKNGKQVEIPLTGKPVSKFKRYRA